MEAKIQLYCDIIYHPDPHKAIPCISDVEIRGGRVGKVRIRKKEYIAEGDLVFISKNYTNFLIKASSNTSNVPYLYGVPTLISNDIKDIHPFRMTTRPMEIETPYISHYSDIIECYTSANFLVRRAEVADKFALYDVICSDLMMALTMFISNSQRYDIVKEFLLGKKLWDMFRGAGTVHEGQVAIKKCYTIYKRLIQEFK